MFYEYVDSGSWTESTYRSNCNDFESLRFRQRVAVDVSERTTQTTMLGQNVTMPVAIAPTGLTGMLHADGEILAALAAKKFGVPFTLSTLSICSLEDVSEATQNHPFWFQLYVMRDRGFVASLIERAKAANCSALVVTVDLPVTGQRHKDLINGLSVPPRLTLRNAANLLSKPRWCIGMAKTKRRIFGNIHGHLSGMDNMSSIAQWVNKQFDPSLTWDDLVWIRSLWPGKLVLKGILDKEDALRALDCGVDAIIVSNHGGRQLDGAPSSIRALGEIVDAIGEHIEVHIDGGICSGQSVLRAISLGARGTYIGRAMLYGLAAGGQEGVEKVLQLIHRELDLSMAFCGVREIQRAGHHNLILTT